MLHAFTKAFGRGSLSESTTPLALAHSPHRHSWWRRGARLIPPASGVANPTTPPRPRSGMSLLQRLLLLLIATRGDLAAGGAREANNVPGKDECSV